MALSLGFGTSLVSLRPVVGADVSEAAEHRPSGTPDWCMIYDAWWPCYDYEASGIAKGGYPFLGHMFRLRERLVSQCDL